MEIVCVKGIVLSTTPFKENSKILNILTKEYGLIGVVSKGCKKLNSKLRLLSEKFAYANFNIYYKKDNLSTLVDGSIINYFENIKSDIYKLSYLSYLSELTSGVYKESESEDIYDLFINAIMKIEEGLDYKIISNILELQYLEYLGINLCLDNCVVCGSSKVSTISLSKGGYVCQNCRTNEIIYDEKVIKLLRLYNYVDISKITSLDIDKSVSDKINDIIDEYYDTYSGIHPKSKKFLKDLEKSN